MRSANPSADRLPLSPSFPRGVALLHEPSLNKGTFEFNYDYCKGCGICVAECPCGAIDMVKEDV